MRAALIRHLPPAIAPGVCYGRLDVAVRSDARPFAVLDALSGFRPQRIWTSPAQRCRALADPIAAGLGLAPVSDERLLEMDFGDWEGMAWDDVPRLGLDAWAADPFHFTPPGGESGADVLWRVRDFADDLLAAGTDCVIIGHAGPLKLLAPMLAGAQPDLLAPSPGFGSVIWIEAPK